MSNTEDRNDETINLDLDEHTSAEDADMDVNTEANANADDDFDYLKEMGPSGSAKPEKYLEFEAEVTADDEANKRRIRKTS